MKYILPALRFNIFMILLLGLIYPIAMTGLAQTFFNQKANGDLIYKDNQIIGSAKIAQGFQKSEYFWPRPSAIDYNPLSSGGSNLGQASAELKKITVDRIQKLRLAHPEQNQLPPQDLIFSSSSGLDPHISLQAASYQAERIANARNIQLEQVYKLIDQATSQRQLGFLGEPVVNVLQLNLSLDALK